MNILWERPDGTVAFTEINPGERLVRSWTPIGSTIPFVYNPPVRLESAIGQVDFAKVASLNVQYVETEQECAARMVSHFRARWADIDQNGKPRHPDLISAPIAALALTDLPPARLFGGWRSRKGILSVDLVAARAALVDETRLLAKSLLDASVTESVEASDIGNASQKQKIKAYRQALYDLPTVAATQLAAISDLNQLAMWQATWPEKPIF